MMIKVNSTRKHNSLKCVCTKQQSSEIHEELTEKEKQTNPQLQLRLQHLSLSLNS